MNESVLLIYGLRDERSHYRNLISAIEEQGREVLPLKMDWSRAEPRYWADQVHKQTAGEQFGTILGHSVGAITGLVFAADLASMKFPPRPFPQLILASPSARFAVDLRNRASARLARESYLHEPAYNGKVPPAFRQLKVIPLVTAVKTQIGPDEISVFVGQRESREAILRAQRLATHFGIKRRVVIPGAHHNFDRNPAYIIAILEQLAKR